MCLRILLILLLFASPCLATDYFLVDSNDCANNGDGTAGTCAASPGATGAFNAIGAGLYAVLGGGNTLWIRRTFNDVQTANVTLTVNNYIYSRTSLIGWPRALKSINADWENGSTTVDNIDSNDMDREEHVGRYIAGPDGFLYLITQITDSNTFVIDRPYQGSTSANEDTNIQADTIPNGISQPSDPDSWGSDADNLPVIDFNNGDYNVAIGKGYTNLYNIEFKNSADSSALVNTSDTGYASFVGCIFSQTTSTRFAFQNGGGVLTIFDRCIFEGNANFTTLGLLLASTTIIKNSAIYYFDKGIYVDGSGVELYNVNIGVEVANGDWDFFFGEGEQNGTKFTDVKLGGTNGEVYFYQHYNGLSVPSVNHNKVIGAYKEYFFEYAQSLKTAVSGATPNKKLSDHVLEHIPATSSYRRFGSTAPELYPTVFKSRKTYDAGTYNVKVWIYNDTGNTLNDTTYADDILLRCRAEAAGYGDATTEYVSKWYYSDEIDILDAADADDWDYLQADSIVVDRSGTRIYCEVLVSTYDAEADSIFIDPVTVNP